MKKLSHYDSKRAARAWWTCRRKSETRRTATAHAFVRIRPSVLKKLPQNPKGDPLEVARIAGIAAAKRTSELIPMCHPLMLSHVDVTAKVEARGVRITATVGDHGADGRRNGGADGRGGGGSDGLRHDQGAG